jgi:glycosyltransferase involved in cell wall biosynthesis
VSTPNVAVIVTCYNQERYIRQALDSIANQTQPPNEIVLIDGFSQDRSVAVIKEWIAENDTPITFIAHDRNYGLCATLNQAMSLIISEFVVTLYGDDWLEPHRLETQSSIFAHAAHDVGMVVGSMREVNHRGIEIVVHDFRDRVEPLAQLEPAQRVEALVGENTIPSPAVMIRSDFVRQVGGYDESLTFDDYDLWMRLLSRYSLVYHSSVVVNYRVLNTSLSRSTARHGDFLLSEAKMVYKNVGLTPTINRRIKARLTVSGRKLSERGDTVRLRALLTMLRTVDPRWRIRFALVVTFLPRGARAVHTMRLLETIEH